MTIFPCPRARARQSEAGTHFGTILPQIRPLGVLGDVLDPAGVWLTPSMAPVGSGADGGAGAGDHCAAWHSAFAWAARLLARGLGVSTGIETQEADSQSEKFAPARARIGPE